MIFNSITFLVFFFVFFQIYWWINNRFATKYRNLFTTLSSYLFYGWWDWRFLSLIIISSILDYTIGLSLSKTKEPTKRKLLLYISVATNLGILGFFKYFNFFIESFQELLAMFALNPSFSTLEILLPVGISFYTFQTLSYTIDIYRKELEPVRDVFSFFAFVAFFPQLVAGPIERASRLLGQFREKKIFSYDYAVAGLRLILWGMFKKVVIADNCGVLVDVLFDTSASTSGGTTIFGVALFAIQIYADFSGYSDMAIGLSKMLGMDLMKNFKTPYFANSFRSFWRRWHISLSTWFRDYVYIPLGGNRGNFFRVNLNIFLTFLLSGLWHGAKFTFIIWGALHGLLLIAERLWKLRVHQVISTIFVIIIVTILWIPFRAESTSHFLNLMESLIQFDTYSLEQIYKVIADFSTTRFLALVLVLFSFFIIEKRLGVLDFSEWISNKNQSIRILSYYIILGIILLLGNFAVKPQFIYFQF